MIVVNNNAPSAVVEVIRRFTESKDEEERDDDEEEDMERCEIEFLPLTTFCQQTAMQNFTSTLELECCPAKFNGRSPSQTDKELYLASQPNFDTPEIVKENSNNFQKKNPKIGKKEKRHKSIFS